MATAIDETTRGELVIEDVGPVERAVIPFPTGGGVVELRGANGIGKSTTLDAIRATLTGDGTKDLSVRRGAPTGSVEAFGLTLRLGKRTSRSGELEVESIETQLDLSKLVDPGLKDDSAADARRLKEVVGLVSISPEAVTAKLAALLPTREEFDRLVPASDLSSAEGDVLLMAERVKRKLDLAALTEERVGNDELHKASVLNERVKDVDLSAPSDSAALQAALEAAVTEHTALVTQRDAAEKAARVEEQARKLLAEYEGQTEALTVSQAETAEALAAAEYDAASEDVRRITDELAGATRAAAVARQKHAAAKDGIADARRRERLIQQWRGQLNAATVAAPAEAKILEASTRAMRCRTALEDGAMIRDALRVKGEADAARKTAKGHLARGEKLREAARGIDGVLSDIVREAGLDVTVRGDRLYYGAKLFGELSHGERWRAVLKMAARCSKQGGVFSIPQEAWEGLQPKVRASVVRTAKELGIVIYTARCSDDEAIVAEVL